MSMLSMAGIIISLDAFGPITDNAGGVAVMSDLPHSVRVVTDELDAVGNTMKAVTKGYAIASAGLAALVLFRSYVEELKLHLAHGHLSGGARHGHPVPAQRPAGRRRPVHRRRAAVPVCGVQHGCRGQRGGRGGARGAPAARRKAGHPQRRGRAGIRDVRGHRDQGGPRPDDRPGVAAGGGRDPRGGDPGAGQLALGGVLLGTIVTGLFMAISMTSSGGAWDNAKKYIEEGSHGGKGSPAHAASVTGDTVGDPYKDTAGPAINPMIKVVNIVAILIIPIFF